MNNRRNDQQQELYDLYAVTERGDKTFWDKIGIGFPNRDGSLSIKLYMFPGLSIQCRRQQPRRDSDQ